MSSRLRRYRAFVVLVGAELVDVENILNLVARQGGGADLHPNIVAEDATGTQAARLGEIDDGLGVEPGKEGGLHLFVADGLVPLLLAPRGR